MIQLPTIKEILPGATRYDSASEFVSELDRYFVICQSQILKVETRQQYYSEGNKSHDAAMRGDFKQSAELMESSRQEDINLYQDLVSRKIDMIRCRPIALPMVSYIKWELEVYKFNSQHGERIFCCNMETVHELFERHISHDFMVFDSKIAFIHDYDESGQIQGGWSTTKLDDIIKLQTLFIFLKSQCQSFKNFVLNTSC